MKSYAIVCLQQGIADGWYGKKQAESMLHHYKRVDSNFINPAIVCVDSDKGEWVPICDGIFHCDYEIYEESSQVSMVKLYLIGKAIEQSSSFKNMVKEFANGKTLKPARKNKGE